jgi:hypothetical protein
MMHLGLVSIKLDVGCKIVVDYAIKWITCFLFLFVGALSFMMAFHFAVYKLDALASDPTFQTFNLFCKEL